MEDTLSKPPTSSESDQPPPASKPLDRKYKFFRDVEVTPEGVAIIRFDGPKKVNSISFDMSKEARKMWETDVANNSDIKAVVFASGKPDMFIAGADIFDLKSVENKQDLIALCEDGLDFFQSMKDKKVPLVCAIDGPALGGGLEWAM
jgi:enoyl-CoA hydratase/carnithine racemase